MIKTTIFSKGIFLLFLTALLSVFLFIAPVRYSPVIFKDTVFVVTFGGLVFLLWSMRVASQSAKTLGQFIAATAALIGVIVIEQFFVVNRHYAFRAESIFIIFIAAMFLLQFLEGEKAIDKISLALHIALKIITLGALVQVALGREPDFIFLNKNVIASFVMLATVFLATLMIGKSYPGKKLLLFIPEILLLTFIGNRTTIVALLFGAGVLLRRQKKVLLALIGLILILLFLSGKAHRFKGLLQDRGSVKERLYVYQVSAEMLRGHPLLGIGLGNYPFSFARIQRFISPAFEHPTSQETVAHNDFLQYLVELGTLRFALFCAVIIGLFVKSKIINKFLGFYVAFFINSLFSFPLHLSQGMLLFSLPFMYSRAAKGAWNNRENFGFREKRKLVAVALMGLLFVVVIVSFVRAYMADQVVTVAEEYNLYNTRAGWLRAYRYYRKAHKLEPYNPRTLHFMGTMLLNVGQPKEARGFFYKALKEGIYWENTFYNLGYSHYAMRDYNAAVYFYKRAREVFIRSFWPNYGLGYVYSSIFNDQRRSLFYLLSGIKYVPETDKFKPRLYSLAAAKYAGFKDYEHAIRLLKLAIAHGDNVEKNRARLKSVQMLYEQSKAK